MPDVKCPHCGKAVPVPGLDVASLMAKAVEQIGPERLAAQDKVPGQLKKIVNAVALLNEKVNVLGEETLHLDLRKHPRIEAVKKTYE